MNRRPRVPLLALAVAVLLASLSLVAWRQGRARETLAEIERIRQETALAEAEQTELRTRIRHLESRARVVPEARRRLDMHTPTAEEIVILPSETP